MYRNVLIAVLLTFSLAHAQQSSRRAADLVAKLNREVADGLARRNVVDRFERYQAYANGRMDASAGTKRWSDKTGNCRLAWVDWLVRNQLDATAEAERFTWQLHQALTSKPGNLAGALRMAAEKLDLKDPPTPRSVVIRDTAQALTVVRNALHEATVAYRAAVAPLSPAQRSRLRRDLYAVSTASVQKSGAHWPARKAARELCDIMEAMDRRALHGAATALSTLANPQLLTALQEAKSREKAAMEGADGELLAMIETPDGVILVGGPGANTYHLDKLSNAAVVIDVGGDDTYLEGSTTQSRPVLALIDLAGNDTYRGRRPGIQGGALLGASVLVDVAGDDVYDAGDIAQGSCLAGVGILIDREGNDSYRAVRRAQGQAVCGLGLLLDRAGNDSYHAAIYAQGFGGPLGLGVLEDVAGKDHYYAGGLFLDGYGDTPGYAGWSQGVGAGPRGSANGGIGVLLDGGGDDVYECDYFSHGGGYWFAAGLARDFGGNDKRLGSTRLAHDGTKRAEKIFLRWGIGYGCHYGVGFVFDDGGNDYYGGNIVGLAFAWDIAATALCDFGGNDLYIRIGGGQGVAREAGLAILYDVGGDDTYEGDGQGLGAAGIQYHPLPACGGNFSFAIDYGGKDTYGGAKKNNNSYQERSSPTGFLIKPEQIP